MPKFTIEGQRELRGDITVSGSKNAALKVLVACLLTRQSCVIKNVPRIEDVLRILELMESMGVEARWTAQNEVTVHASTVEPETLDMSKVRQLRASALLMGGVVGRCGTIKIPGPGGDQIGSRPMTSHFDAFRSIGIEVNDTGELFIIEQKKRADVSMTMSEFSVTATENIMLASVLSAGNTTTVHCAAADPSVQDLAWFLNSLGGNVEGAGTHTLTIRGVRELRGTDGYTVMPDPIEASTFICMASAGRYDIAIRNFSPNFIRSELVKFREAGIAYELKNQHDADDHRYQIADLVMKPSTTLRALPKLHNMPYPGISPDVLPPFTVLLTQASGTSLVHDWMYEGRLKYVEELNKMGADIFVADPHRILVTGPRALYGTSITNYDIRTGASLFIAALIASGMSTLQPVYQLDRGYENLDVRVRQLGAHIDRIPD